MQAMALTLTEKLIQTLRVPLLIKASITQKHGRRHSDSDYTFETYSLLYECKKILCSSLWWFQSGLCRIQQEAVAAGELPPLDMDAANAFS
jgi:hypothetical protein